MKTNTGIWKLFLKLLLSCIPAFLILILYFIFDPFKVLYSYQNFNFDDGIVKNRDYISSELYLKNQKLYNYDSFIFGSSRTLAFNVKEWKKYIGQKSSPFVFDANAETIYGIYHKIKYIYGKNLPLNNVIILVCRDVTFRTDEDYTGHLYIKHPVIANTSYFKFQFEFIKSFFDFSFFTSYIFEKISKYNLPALGNYKNKYAVETDSISNQIILKGIEDAIKNDSSDYYRNMKNILYTRDTVDHYPAALLNDKQITFLEEINEIFKNKRTNFKIIIGPLYEQKYFNKDDLEILNKIFQNENIIDFSGINEFTISIGNYYENSHYRPIVGDIIFKKIYK